VASNPRKGDEMFDEVMSRRGALGAFASASAAGVASGLGVKADDKPGKAPPGTFRGREALVTGAARGIGRATALAFASEGADVAICDVAEPVEHIPYPMGSLEELHQTKAQVEALGVRCFAAKIDVRLRWQVEALVKDVERELGPVEFCIANAGVVAWGALSEVTDEAWRAVIDTNVTGVANTIRAVLPGFKARRRGRIVTLASSAGEGGIANIPAYVASKWAVIGLTKSVALEMGPHGVTANAVCPTGVRTPMLLLAKRSQTPRSKPGDPPTDVEIFETMAGRPHTDEEIYEEVDAELLRAHALPVGLLDPKDVADGIIVLSSEKSRYISATALDIQAGGNARNVT
jgi:NAD(P)-dependent dehydrogenase (short-subunit alcohol dehydrogenase family)